ncbi:hypothetical protein PybrP1_009247 [[Pythium] brassicae (nom. inval.)]|nr:hypothetical protein PybrP1_009247 [[Pythium] brassicae (nom. inval.)]
MAYFQSPIEPLFYAHHGFIDALQAIYLKCQLGSGTTLLTAMEKGSDSRFWANCPRRSTGSFTSTDEVYMRLQSFSNAWVQVRTNALTLLYPYFKDLPAKYADYVDAKDLGVYSYSYDLTGAMQTMFTDCGASTSLASGTSLEAEAETSSESEGAASGASKQHESESETTARRWSVAIFESARLHGYTDRAAEEQMEMVSCMHKHECLGEVQDYSALFRKNFRVEGHPRCFTLVQALLDGDKVIGVPHWREITKRFVPCPNEGNEPAELKSTAPSYTATSVQ